MKRYLLQTLAQDTFVRAKLDSIQPDDPVRRERLTNRQKQIHLEICKTEIELRKHDPSYSEKFPGGYLNQKSLDKIGELRDHLTEGLDPVQSRLLNQRALDQENKWFYHKTQKPSQYLTLLNVGYNPDEPRDELAEWLNAISCKKTLPNNNPNWPAQPRAHGEWASEPTQIVPTSPNYDVNTVTPIPGMKVKYVPAAEIKIPQQKSSPPIIDSLHRKMAAEIFKYEARVDKNGKVIVYHPPEGDGGGDYEVAGIDVADHPEMAAKLKQLVESGHQDEAKKLIEDYILKYTNSVTKYTNNPAIEFYLRDTALNRGPSGAILILQMALGVTPDGKVGNQTLTALHTAEEHPEQLLDKLNAARKEYEDKFMGKRPQFRPGLISRWNQALNFAKSLLPEN